MAGGRRTRPPRSPVRLTAPLSDEELTRASPSVSLWIRLLYTGAKRERKYDPLKKQVNLVLNLPDGIPACGHGLIMPDQRIPFTGWNEMANGQSPLLMMAKSRFFSFSTNTILPPRRTSLPHPLVSGILSGQTRICTSATEIPVRSCSSQGEEMDMAAGDRCKNDRISRVLEA